MEIETADEAHLFQVAERLGFDTSKALHGSVEVVYQHEFDVTEDEIDAWEEILFGPVPDWLESRRK